MKSLKWQIEGAVILTIGAAALMIGCALCGLVGWVGFGAGLIVASWATVLDHKYGTDSHQE